MYRVKVGHTKRIIFPSQLELHDLNICPHIVTISISRPI